GSDQLPMARKMLGTARARPAAESPPRMIRKTARWGGASCAHPDHMNAARPNTAPIITRSRGKDGSIIADPFHPRPAVLRVETGPGCGLSHCPRFHRRG